MSASIEPSIDADKLVLGIDVGTSRLKAAAYDAQLRLVRQSNIDTSSIVGPGKGQLDAVSLWGALREQLHDLLASIESRKVAGIGVSGMAESGCLIDAAGNPVNRMLLWHDRRGIRQAVALRRAAGDQFARVTGLKITSVRSIAKWMWMARHGAPTDARWCGAPEWIVQCLTGNWLTDSTLAVRTGVLDVLKDEYSDTLLRTAGAPIGLFPPVGGTPAHAGWILPSVASDLGLPVAVQVVIAGHDDIVAAYGAGGATGDLIDSGGTAEGLIRIVNETPLPADTVRAKMAMTRYFTPGAWALIAGAGSTGALMQRAAQLLGRAPADLDEMVSPPGEYAKDVIEVRLSKNTLPSIKIRSGAPSGEAWSAVLDTVCDRVQRVSETLDRIGGRAQRLILIGGAARSRELVKRKSERLGLPAITLSGVDATTRGAAALAALASVRQSRRAALAEERVRGVRLRY